MLQQLRIGQIVNTQGVKGEVKIIPLTDDPARFSKLIKIKFENNGTAESGLDFEIEGIKFLKNAVVAKLKGIDNIDDAEKLRGLYIIVDRKDAVKLPENSYFICDILGMKVIDSKKGLLGVVEDILQTGSNDVYIVKDENKNEILIPAIKSVVKSILLNEKEIHVELPRGLIDDEI